MLTSFHAQLLAFGPPPGGARDPKGEMVYTLGMFAIMGVLFYFALIRPQKVRAKQLEDRIKSLKSGDKVLTSGGIVGTIVSVNEKTFSLRSDGSKFEVLKSAVSEVTERRNETADAKP